MAAETLVKYHTPVIVAQFRKAGGRREASAAASQPATDTEDLLNSILPPKEWSADGQMWARYVSPTPATRLDVINLQDALDRALQQQMARETGICPIREEVYGQAYDEIIRQVTVACAERGLLLLRVRDEIRMTVAAYRGLYESAIAYGMRKALVAEYNRGHLVSKAEQLEADCAALRATEVDLKARCDNVSKASAEVREVDAAAHEVAIEKLKATIASQKANLETMLAAPQKK